jgi:hypothetical protein
VTEGAEIAAAGAVLSAVKAELGPPEVAKFPALSMAVPAAIDIPNVPSPVMADIVTIRVVFPVPVTATVQLAVPVLINVTLASDRVSESAPV